MVLGENPPFYAFCEVYSLALTGIIEYLSRMENAALTVTVTITVTPLHLCLSVYRPSDPP